MVKGCNQQVKAGRDKHGKQVWVSCGRACDEGKALCPRHGMLSEFEKTTAADKQVQKQQAGKHATEVRR